MVKEIFNKIAWRVIAVLGLIYATNGYSQDNLSSFSRDTDVFLKANTNNGLVSYAKIKKDPRALNRLVNMIGVAELGNKSMEEKKAFYLNAYNLLVVQKVVENYPLSSPMDVKGFFDMKNIKVANEIMSLNDLENKIIRPAYKDPRVHFALVCAAEGCPKIEDSAYTKEDADKQLDEQAKAAINDPAFIKVDNIKKKVMVSEIFKWYEKDFLLDSRNILEYLNKYRYEKIPSDFKIEYYKYDWKLNDDR